ncbi:MAG: insulinase family protein [Candidatus Hydrogenedentota bacterium]
MIRMTCSFLVVFAMISAGLGWAEANSGPAAIVQGFTIPYQKFVLNNGLTLIVHEDHKAPIVAVNVWYHVGSKNEKRGKTGFAHLFEHLMFNGTENFNDDYFQPLEKVGATDMNGTTNSDRTNYFQNVPASALDVALWMEADRMGHLLGAIDQAKLDEQRGVVQNEKRQGENQPYGVAEQLLTENTYPVGHPYSWTTIGSMEDLNAASLEDVGGWFKTYYGAANAVLSVAGDVDTLDVKQRVEKYFGDIPSGPPIAKHDAWVARREGEQRQTVRDRVPQARIYKVWNVPQWGTPEMAHLDLLSDLLSDGKNSRLYKRLVYDAQICTDVAAYVFPQEIAGQFMIVATAKAGADLGEVERAVDEELAALMEKGPAKKELDRIKTQYFARFVRGAERIGGFGGKSDILAMNEVYGGSPDAYQTQLDRVRDVTPEDLRDVARAWLNDGVYVLEVLPFPAYSAAAEGAGRSAGPPTAGYPPAAKFPEILRATLANGLQLVLAERHDAPLVTMDLMINAGFAADSLGTPGLAGLALDLLDEGTTKRSSLDISAELAALGAVLSTSASLDTCTLYTAS